MTQDGTAHFHAASSDRHPNNSIGNQQIINGGRQVGAIEYVVSPTGSVSLEVTNTQGNVIATDI